MKKYTLKNRKVNKRKTRHSNKKSLKEASNIKKGGFFRRKKQIKREVKREIHFGVEPKIPPYGKKDVRFVLQNTDIEGNLTNKRWDCSCEDVSKDDDGYDDTELNCECNIEEDEDNKKTHGIWDLKKIKSDYRSNDSDSDDDEDDEEESEDDEDEDEDDEDEDDEDEDDEDDEDDDYEDEDDEDAPVPARAKSEDRKKEQEKNINPNSSIYEILGLNPNASPADVRRAFYKKALIHHPDKGGKKENFQIISNIFEKYQRSITGGGAKSKEKMQKKYTMKDAFKTYNNFMKKYGHLYGKSKSKSKPKTSTKSKSKSKSKSEPKTSTKLKSKLKSKPKASTKPKSVPGTNKPKSK